MTDVVVVGAGPVGLVAACELARRGVAVRVIDRLPAPTDQSRAIVVHARSLEMFQRMGVVDEVIASGVHSTSMHMFGSGRRLVKVDLDHIDSSYPFSVTTAQTETERILAARLSALGGRVERGVELVALSQDSDGAHLALRDADGDTERVDAAYVVGADGSHSTVRDQIGLRLEGSFQGERFVLGDVDADHDLEPSSFYTYFAAEGALLVFPMRGQRLRIMAQVDSAPSQPMTATVTQAQLQRLVDQRAPGIQITRSRWLTDFEIHHAQVPTYRVGRVFLAGDAAHVHSPAGGQGMNTGMQDAFNLAWKLAFALEDMGADHDRLLDSYHDERHPVAADVIRFTNLITKVGTLRSDLAIALRDHAAQLAVGLAPVRHAVITKTEEVSVAYRHSPIVLPGRPGHGAKIHAGDHLPPVPDPEVERRIAAAGAAGDGRLLVTVTVANGTAPPALAGPSSGWRQVLVSRTGERPEGYDEGIADPAGSAAERLGLSRGGRLVVRPDGYVGYLDAIDNFDLDRYLARLTVPSTGGAH